MCIVYVYVRRRQKMCNIPFASICGATPKIQFLSGLWKNAGIVTTQSLFVLRIIWNIFLL